MKNIPIFDNILNSKWVKGVCRKCGNASTHNLIYCKQCGDIFFKSKDLTLLDAIRIVKFSTGKGGSYYKPYYIAAIHKLKIQAFGYTEKDFENYINKIVDI